MKSGATFIFSGGEEIECQKISMHYSYGIKALVRHDYYDEHGKVHETVEEEGYQFAAYGRHEYGRVFGVNGMHPNADAAHDECTRVHHAQYGHVFASGGRTHTSHYQNRQQVEKDAQHHLRHYFFNSKSRFKFKFFLLIIFLFIIPKNLTGMGKMTSLKIFPNSTMTFEKKRYFFFFYCFTVPFCC